MQTYDYSETLFHFLTSSSREIDMGPAVRQYKLDQNQPEYYFFTKMPDTTLNIAVFNCYGGEIHQVDSDAFRVRRTEERYINSINGPKIVLKTLWFWLKKSKG